MDSTIRPASWASLSLLVLAALAAPALPCRAQETTLPFQSMVTPLRAPGPSMNGSFNYSVPIELPSARGPVPQLQLAYDSSIGNGLLGVGWMLAGIPAITRVQGTNGTMDR